MDEDEVREERGLPAGSLFTTWRCALCRYEEVVGAGTYDNAYQGKTLIGQRWWHNGKEVHACGYYKESEVTDEEWQKVVEGMKKLAQR